LTKCPANEVLGRTHEFTVEDLAKSAWSWATIGGPLSTEIVIASCMRARSMPPISTWNNLEFLDTGHAFVWSAWVTARPELAWGVFNDWASRGMTFDAASFGLLMMDAAYSKTNTAEMSLLTIMQRCSAFEELIDVFSWCIGRAVEQQEAPNFMMRFDTRMCPGTCFLRGTHAKLSLLVSDVQSSGACDAAAALEAVRVHSYGPGQWLKIAGGGKANLIMKSLQSRSGRLGEIALELGVFVGYTTMRIGQQAVEAATAKGGSGTPLAVVGLEVEPVHVCVARWMIDIARLSGSVEIWAGMAQDLILRIADECGERTVQLCFMDHRGTRFHDDLDRLDKKSLFSPMAQIIADNVLKPAAPVFLWVVSTNPSYLTQRWALGEFVQYYVEDWMVVSSYLEPCGHSSSMH